MYEPITIERLENYRGIVRELDRLLQQKEKLKQKISSLSAVDYSKSKVTTGNAKKTSEQERYAIALEEINRKIDEYTAWVGPEHQVIKTQIARVKKWEYRKLLVYRYLEKWKWIEIIQDFFQFEDDFEDQKNFKYKDKIMFWNRQALKQLEEVSALPFIHNSKQLTIGEIG